MYLKNKNHIVSIVQNDPSISIIKQTPRALGFYVCIKRLIEHKQGVNSNAMVSAIRGSVIQFKPEYDENEMNHIFNIWPRGRITGVATRRDT